MPLRKGDSCRLPCPLWALCVIAIMAVVLTGVERPATSPADGAKIAVAIAQLGDADFAVREEAMRALWGFGKAAEQSLTEAAGGAEPEIAARAREILLDFRYGIGPESPAELVALVRAYRRGNVEEKRGAVESLFMMGPKAYAALARMCEAEEDPGLRARVLHELGGRAVSAVGVCVGAGDYATAEQLLEISVAAGSEEGCRCYAAYHVLRGQADAKIALLRKRMEAEPSFSAAKALTYLYRATGDLKSARWAAEMGADAELEENILFELGDWKGLAASLVRRVGDDADIEKLSFLAAYHRLAGDTDSYEHALRLIRRYADGAKASVELVAKALLLNDRTDEAIALHIKAGNVQRAFELLCAQQRYQEAFEAAERDGKGDRAERATLQCVMGRMLHYLGRRKEAIALFDEVGRQEAADIGFEGQCALVEAELQCGLEDRALAHAADAANTGGANLPAVFGALFPGRRVDSVTWWNYYRVAYPSEKAGKTVGRMRDLLYNKLGEEELAALCRGAAEFAREMSKRDGAAFLAVVSRTMAAAGQDKLAQSVFEQAVAMGSDIEVGHLAAARGQWALAAGLYGSGDARGNVVSSALRGWALVRAGREKEGRAVIDRVSLLALGDTRQRFVMAEALAQAGLTEGEREQFELIIRTAPFWSGELIETLANSAQEAARRGDYAVASERGQRSLLACLRASVSFVNARNYLMVPHLVHRARAAGLIQAGRVEEALKEIDACNAILPGDITLTIDLLPLFEKAGRAKEADAFYARGRGFQEKLCADYPNSPGMHNSLAWMLVRCGRDLDEAMVHGQRAAELDPRNCAILDTLAEIHFQRGEKAEAISLMEKCIALEPQVARHKAALKRLEGSSRTSAPIE